MLTETILYVFKPKAIVNHAFSWSPPGFSENSSFPIDQIRVSRGRRFQGWLSAPYPTLGAHVHFPGRLLALCSAANAAVLPVRLLWPHLRPTEGKGGRRGTLCWELTYCLLYKVSWWGTKVPADGQRVADGGFSSAYTSVSSFVI